MWLLIHNQMEFKQKCKKKIFQKESSEFKKKMKKKNMLNKKNLIN